MSERPSTEVAVLQERETPRGLAFLIGVGDRAIEVLLDWADYNLWSPDGADAPSRIAAAVAREAVARYGAADLPDPLDAARLRRHWPEADASIAARLRPGG